MSSLEHPRITEVSRLLARAEAAEAEVRSLSQPVHSSPMPTAEAHIKALERLWEEQTEHAEAAEAEVERLRAALIEIIAIDPKHIRADDYGQACRIARAALEAKP